MLRAIDMSCQMLRAIDMSRQTRRAADVNHLMLCVIDLRGELPLRFRRSGPALRPISSDFL